VKQFSIFLPNKVGAMLEIVKLLATRNTHVLALSIAEQTDSAIARIVVSDPETVENIFHEHDVAFGVCEMVVVELQEVATELSKLLAALLMAEVNMHFSYPLITRPRGLAALAMPVDDAECACKVLEGEGFKMLSQADISRGSRGQEGATGQRKRERKTQPPSSSFSALFRQDGTRLAFEPTTTPLRADDAIDTFRRVRLEKRSR
jgi:hypothetical protein